MTTPSVTIGSLVRRYRYLLVALALLVFGVVAVLASAPPGLTWNQASPSPTVVAGGATSTTTISFTATGKLPNAVVQLSPSFAGLVSVSPTNLGTVFQGQTVTLTLTSSAPASSTPAVVQGSVQIQKQQNPPLVVYGSPLQVNLNVTWPTLSNQGATVTYPPTWILDQQTLSLGGPISLRNFAQFAHGGVRPNRGAEMDVNRLPMPQGSLNTFISADLAGATIDATSTQVVDGVNATHVSYHDSYTATTQEVGTTVYVPFGAFLYEFNLVYFTGDPNESNLLTTFNNLIDTATLAAN
jgi:hypothetical protein